MDYLKWYVEEVMLPVFSPQKTPEPKPDHQHEWLRDDSGVTECAVCGATRFVDAAT